MFYLLLLLVFITIFTSVNVLHSNFSKESYTDRVEAYLEPNTQKLNIDGAKPVKASLKEKCEDFSKKLISTLELGKSINKFDRYLEKANIPFRGEEMLFIISISMLLITFLGTALTGKLYLGIFLGVLVIPIFIVFVNNKIRKRMVKFENQLCDALDMIVSSLRGGFSFSSALEIISKDMPDPIAGEFAKVVKEISLGMTQEKALNNLLERVQSDDLKLIVIATNIQIQTGGNLAEILNNISTTIRDRLQLKREVKTLTAQGRTSGLIVGLLPIILFVVIFLLDPSYMKLLISNIVGILLLIFAAIDEIIGILIIKKIINIKY